jgi:inner membrane transporter RhtA
MAARLGGKLPPTSFFLVSAIFHYLGPAIAVLLFAHVAALGVMWLRIATAAAVFALWRRPWRVLGRLDRRQLAAIGALGVLLAVMNSVFYLAVARLPLATVGAIEFLGTVILATLGVRTRRNAAALVLTVGGVALLTAPKLAGQPLGFVFAFANCAAFMGYVVLGHWIANSQADPGRAAPPAGRADPAADAAGSAADAAGPAAGAAGIDQLGAAMIIAVVIATPAGISSAVPAFSHPLWLAWGIGVGVCSSVIPYVTDQLAMARLPRATFALMLALLPACAAGIGAVVLRQIPGPGELAGIGLVISGLLAHQATPEQPCLPRLMSEF